MAQKVPSIHAGRSSLASAGFWTPAPAAAGRAGAGGAAGAGVAQDEPHDDEFIAGGAGGAAGAAAAPQEEP